MTLTLMGRERAGSADSLMETDMSEQCSALPPREEKQRFKVSMIIVGLPVFLPRRHIFFNK